MIAKKISRKASKKSKFIQIKNLVDYIRNPDIKNPEEKILYHGSRGFFAETHDEQRTEMIALSVTKPKSKMPVNHYIFSWKEGEQPTTEQIEELIDIFQKESGLINHQIVYGLHHNTENIHLHIAVNRIDLDGESVHIPNKGFDIKMLHKIIAQVEHIQGWESEKNSLYMCDENGQIFDTNLHKNQMQIKQNARNFEINTGEKSAIRIAQESALPILENAKTWQEVHEKLTPLNIKFQKKGSGAILFIDDIPIKASTVSRKTSLKKIQERLGEFQENQTHPPYELQPKILNLLNHQVTLAQENDYGKLQRQLTNESRLYRHGVREYSKEQIRERRASELSSESRRYGQRTGSISSTGAGTSTSVRSTTDATDTSRNSSDATSEATSRHASIQKRELHGIGFRGSESKQSIARAESVSPRIMFTVPQRFVAFNSPKSRRKRQQIKRKRQQRVKGVLHANERYNNRAYNFLRWSGTARAITDVNFKEWLIYQNKKRIYNLIRTFKKLRQSLQQNFQKIDKNSINFHKNSLEKLPIKRKNNLQPIPHFEDWLNQNGKKIEANKWRYEKNENFIFIKNMAKKIKIFDFSYKNIEQHMIQLREKNINEVFLYGHKNFIKLSNLIAQKIGISVKNFQKNIHDDLTKNKEKIMNETENLIKYYSAVDADKYRVTCMKITSNNEKKAFILDKQYGVNGFDKEQIIDRVNEMVKIQSCGDNIYLTPLSEKKHHILIDDMNPDELQKFLKDGYNPAVILKSSPNNFQAILTIPKLGSTYDRDVGNRITERLNKLYGDEKLSGCIHPHRIPGFLNQKAKHQRLDGSFPEVLLLHNNKTTCTKALLFSKEINKEYQDNAKNKAKLQSAKLDKAKSYVGAGNTNNAYFLHFDNIKQHIEITDKSRVDSMIALRLRATGHSEMSIKNAIQECAPALRDESERKNWEDYAQRTTAYAFGIAGDRELAKNDKYLNHWIKLEEREVVKNSNQKINNKKLKL